jgi:hypothetical protein
VDSSKQQQINQWSDGHENGAKTTAITHLLTLIPAAICLAPSGPSELSERLRLVIAPICCANNKQQQLSLCTDGQENGIYTKTTINYTLFHLDSSSDMTGAFTGDSIRRKVKARHRPIVGEDIRDVSLRVSAIWLYR